MGWQGSASLSDQSWTFTNYEWMTCDTRWANGIKPISKVFLIKICIKGLVKICPKEKSKEMENGKGLIFKMIFQWHKRYEYKFSLIWVIIQREKSSNYLSTTKK